ncbi:MAG: hypothetical protein ACLSAO_06535 [Anaerovoracaceae bacterium]
MGNNDKKIDTRVKLLNKYLDNICKYKLEKESQNDEKKIVKLNKKIDGEKKMILINIEALNKLGANINNIYEYLNDEYKSLMKEILPNSTDNTDVKKQKKRNFLINEHKNRLNKLKEAYEKYPMYDENLSIEEKLKNKIYNCEKEVGWYLYMQADKDGEVYKPEWNYLEHINESPEFTEEEKKILNRCYKIGEEYDRYRDNKIDKKFQLLGDFVGDTIMHYGDKRLAKKLSGDVFTEAVEKVIYPERNLSRSEIKMLGKVMTIKFIEYSLDEDAIIEYLNILREVVSEIKGYDIGDLNNKPLVEMTDHEHGLMYESLKLKMNTEEAFLTYSYAILDAEERELLKALDKYSLEELGIDVDIDTEKNLY